MSQKPDAAASDTWREVQGGSDAKSSPGLVLIDLDVGEQEKKQQRKKKMQGNKTDEKKFRCVHAAHCRPERIPSPRIASESLMPRHLSTSEGFRRIVNLERPAQTGRLAKRREVKKVHAPNTSAVVTIANKTLLSILFCSIRRSASRRWFNLPISSRVSSCFVVTSSCSAVNSSRMSAIVDEAKLDEVVDGAAIGRLFWGRLVLNKWGAIPGKSKGFGGSGVAIETQLVH
ncbi:hypothetical protein B0H13DRAFT_1966394 [Mycena leptocephala]|nr:hypothetical protein B0H13DRAFT_1966394 [Mycena leptocephala]